MRHIFFFFFFSPTLQRSKNSAVSFNLKRARKGQRGGKLSKERPSSSAVFLLTLVRCASLFSSLKKMMCFALSGAIFFLLAESPPLDLQVTAYRWWCAHARSSTNWVWLQIIFCLCVHEATLFSFFRSLLRENGRSLRLKKMFIKNKLGDRMMKPLLNSVIAKYFDLSVSQLATDKSRYFPQPRSIILLISLVHYIVALYSSTFEPG